MRSYLFTPLIAFTLCMAANLSFAGEGHDHGDAAPAAAGAASPRVEAHSDLFELVGVVDKGQMTVWLDRYASNEPVPGAKIDYEAGASKGVAQPQPDGTYLVKFDGLSKPGDLAFSFTVTAGADTDLLAGDLALKDPHDHHDEAQRPWRQWLTWAAAAAVSLIFLAFAVRRFKARKNSLR